MQELWYAVCPSELLHSSYVQVRRYPDLALVLTPWKQGEARVGQLDRSLLQGLQR